MDCLPATTKRVAIVERWPKVEAPLYTKLQQLQLQHQSQATMLTYCSTLKWQDINIIIGLFCDGNLRSITKFPYE